MCGIVGLVEPGELPVDEALVRGMAKELVHRGPDEDGFFFEPGVGLGARRLAILDLAAGHQPVFGEQDRVCAVFNGEIYNYRSVRQELLARGHTLRAAGDTEVLPHLYEEYGDDLVVRLNGMFAFAIWDRRRRRLLLARDRVGIKPLYYSVDSGRLAFASELRALLHVPWVQRRLDPVALAQYLLFEYVPSPRTILAGVRRLEPGCCVSFEAGRARITRYWDFDLSASEDGQPRSEREYVEELQERLQRAVDCELASDVPLGVFLSGGVDSTSILSAASQTLGHPPPSFAIGFREPSFDETRAARLAAARIGAEHRQVVLDETALLEVVPQLADLFDEPLADAAIVPTYLLSRFARSWVKVALSGDGGDELFGGYSTLQAHRLAGWLTRLPAWAWNPALRLLGGLLPVSAANLSLGFKLRQFHRGLGYPLPVRHHVWMGAFEPPRVLEILGPGAGESVDLEQILEPVTRHLAVCRARAWVNRVLYLDVKLYLEGDILAKVDRASMACSLEVRVPLLNVELLDFAACLPDTMKLHGLTRRYLYRKAVEPLVPPETRRRSKKGLNMPVAAWLRGPLRDLLGDACASLTAGTGGLFDARSVERLHREHLRRYSDHRKPLWTLLVLELWRQRWLVGANAPRPAAAARQSTER